MRVLAMSCGEETTPQAVCKAGVCEVGLLRAVYWMVRQKLLLDEAAAEVKEEFRCSV